jgi:hypothetical protein
MADNYLLEKYLMLKPQKRHLAFSIRHMMPKSHTNSASSTDKQKAKLDFSWVSLFTLSITAFTAVVFGAGKAYRQSYLEFFGLSDTVIPWSFQDVAYLGITRQLVILAAALMVAIGLAFVVMLLTEAILWVLDQFAGRRIKTSSNDNQKNAIKSSAEISRQVGQFLVNSVGSIYFFGFWALLFIARAEQLGGIDAQTSKESVAQGSKVKPKLPYVTIERIVGGQRITEAGYLITCSERICGLYSPDKDKEATRLVPLDNVAGFRYRN